MALPHRFWAWTSCLWRHEDPAVLGGTDEESQLQHGSESLSQEILTKFIQPIPGSRREQPSPLGTVSSGCLPKSLCGTARKNHLSFMTAAKVLPLQQSPQMCQLKSEQPQDSEGQGPGQGAWVCQSPAFCGLHIGVTTRIQPRAHTRSLGVAPLLSPKSSLPAANAKSSHWAS